MIRRYADQKRPYAVQCPTGWRLAHAMDGRDFAEESAFGIVAQCDEYLWIYNTISDTLLHKSFGFLHVFYYYHYYSRWFHFSPNVLPLRRCYKKKKKDKTKEKTRENPSISWRHKSFNFAHTDDYRCLLLNDTMERFSPLLALCEVLCKLSQMIKWPVMRADFETSCWTNGRWFHMPWSSCGVTVMTTQTSCKKLTLVLRISWRRQGTKPSIANVFMNTCFNLGVNVLPYHKWNMHRYKLKGKRATGFDTRASSVNVQHSLCRIVMEYYLLRMYLKGTICHIIMAKSHLVVSY